MGAKDKEKSQKRQRNKFRKIQKMEQGIRWDDKWIKQYLKKKKRNFNLKQNQFLQTQSQSTAAKEKIFSEMVNGSQLAKMKKSIPDMSLP